MVFMTTVSYKEAILKAVNLVLDTDTVGAVAGGLASVYYGLVGFERGISYTTDGRLLGHIIMGDIQCRGGCS